MAAAVSIFGCSLLAAIVQSCCGSGYAMLVTALLPLFIPFSDAVVISCISSLFGNIMLTVKYRKYIRFQVIAIPAAICMIVTIFLVFVAEWISDASMKQVYGGVLILAAAVFFFWGNHIHLKNNFPTAVAVGGCVGFTNGFFAVGGPFMSLYLLSILEDKKEFIGTIQFFFLICGLTGFFSRVVNGMVTVPLIKTSFISLGAICMGIPIGTQILKRLDFRTLKRVVYGFIAIIGYYSIFSNM